MFSRIINPSNNNSFFIFGARGTGKTTWLKQEFLSQSDHVYIDLLDPDEEEKYSKDPNQLKLKVASLPATHRSIRKQQRQNPKFYFFDLGIARSLSGVIIQKPIPSTTGFGRLFEQFVILEIMRLNSYLEKDFRLSYLRTKDDVEIDLIIERPGQSTVFVEIKSSSHVDERDTRTLKSFAKDLGNQNEYVCLSLDGEEKKADGIRMMHWEEGLKKIGLNG